jgi:mono/diheme cytochrome c family protein
MLVSSCSSSLYFPTAADASAETSLEELNEGRRLYTNYCSGCHALHLPTQFSEEMWNETLDKMQLRSKTTNSEKAIILKYLIVSRQAMMR